MEVLYRGETSQQVTFKTIQHDRKVGYLEDDETRTIATAHGVRTSWRKYEEHEGLNYLPWCEQRIQ